MHANPISGTVCVDGDLGARQTVADWHDSRFPVRPSVFGKDAEGARGDPLAAAYHG
jgi:hypothetical protein